MAENEYLDVVGDQIPQGKAPTNEYDELVGADAQPVANAIKVSAQQEPERHAEILNLAKEFNLPTTVVERQYDWLKQTKKEREHNPQEIAEKYPATAGYLSNPQNAGLSRREIDYIKSIEDHASGKTNALFDFGSDLGGAFATGGNNLMSSVYMLAPAYGIANIEDVAQDIADHNKRAQELAARKPEYAKLFEETVMKEAADVGAAATKMRTAFDGHSETALRDFASGAIATVGETLDLVWSATNSADKLKGLAYTTTESGAFSAPALLGSIAGAATGGQAGLVAGSLLAPVTGLSSIPVGYTAGVVTGTFSGSFAGGATTEIGAWMNGELQKRGYDTTNPQDIVSAFKNPELIAAVRAQAERKGLATAAVDGLFSMFAGRVKFGKSLAGRVASKTTDIGVQTVGESASELAGQYNVSRDWSKVDAGEVLLEGLASLGHSAAEVILLSPKEAISRVSEMRGELSSNPVDATKEVATEIQAAIETAKKIKSIQDMAAVVRQMPDTAKVPGKIAEIVDRTSGGQSVFFQVDDFDNYFKRKNISPVDAAENLVEGGAKKYLEAKENGTPIEMPLGQVIEKTASDVEGFNELSAIMRTEHDGKSLMESDETMQSAPAIVAQIAQEAADESKRVKTRDEIISQQARSIGDEIESQIKTTGRYSDRDAKLVGDLWAQRYERRAKIRGVTPEALEQERKVFIKNATDEIVASEGEQTFEQSADVVSVNAPSELGFYSALKARVAELNFETIPAQDLLNKIRSLPGVKKDEILWVGLDKYLEERGKEKVSKADVQAFIEENQLALSQRVQGTAFVPDRAVRQLAIDEIPHVDSVEWVEEQLSADEVDPGGYLRSDSAYEDAKEDWRYNRENDSYLREMAERIEAEIRKDFPNESDEEIEDRVKDRFIEERSDEWFDYETSMIDSGESDFSEVMLTINGIDSGSIAIRFILGNEADLYVNGSHESSGDPNRLKQLAIDYAVDEGWLSAKPRPEHGPDDVMWLDLEDDAETGNQRVKGTLQFGGETQEFFIEGSGEIFTDRYEGDLEQYVEGTTFRANNMDDAKRLVLDDLVREGILRQPDEAAKPEETEAVKEKPSVDLPTAAARWDKIMLEGGDNEREFILNIKPRPGQKDFGGVHFNDKNTLVHVRTSDRKTKSGEKVFHLDEIQSDWIQQGREFGYEGEVKAAPEMLAIANEYRQLQLERTNSGLDTASEEYSRLKKQVEDLEARFMALAVEKKLKIKKGRSADDIITEYGRTTGGEDLAIPVPPVRESSQAMSLAFKRMLSVAVSGGYDTIIWSPGQVHVDRYNQARYLNELHYRKENGEFYISGITKAGSTIDEIGPYEDSKLESVVGKAIAEKIRRDEGTRKGDMMVLGGGDLVAGDQGHKHLYDKVFKSAAADIIKKLDKDAKVTVLNATEAFGEPLREKSHHYRNRDEDREFNEFWEIKITDKMREEIKKGQTYFQEAKGQIRIGRAAMNIELFAEADISTLLHESSHAWLEEMRLDYEAIKAITGPLTIEQQQLIDDAEAVLKDLGVSSFDEIKTEHHEAWAKMAEKYFLEGKSPSAKLAGAFARFKQWMILLFKNLSLQNVKMSDEIKSVFNRLLASQEEIDELYAEAGLDPLLGPQDFMTEKDAQSYMDASREARGAAEDILSQRLLDEHRREQSSMYREKYKEVEAEVTAEVENDRVYMLLEKLQAKKDKDPDAFKLDRKALVALIGEDAVKKLPRPYIYAAEGGVLPEMVAPIFGYNDAAEMLAEIAAAPKKKELIKATTESRIATHYPSLISNPIDMKREATNAVHATKVEELLRFELEFLWKISPKDAKAVTAKLIQRLPSTKAIRQEATRIIGKTPLAEVKPYIYLRAEYRAAKAAAAAYKRGDLHEAFEQKRKQIVNLELYKQAQATLEKANKAKKLFKKLRQSDAKISKNRDMNLVNAARAILATHGIGDTEKTAQDYLESMRKYDQEGYAAILPIVAAAELPRGRDPLSVSVAEFADLMLAIESLWSLAKTSQEITIGEEKKSLDEAREDLVNYIETTFNKASAKASYQKDRSLMGEVKRGLLGARALLRRAEHFAFALDLQNLGGIVQGYITRPVRNAQERFKPIAKEYQKKLVEVLSGAEITFDKIAAPEIGYTFHDKAELLGALLHIGNASNKKKLLLGYGWAKISEDGVLDSSAWESFFYRATKSGVITKADMDAIQGVWDLFEEVKPLAQRAFKEIHGHYFAEIEPDPVTTPWGEYRGGYAPAVTDKDLVQDSAARASEQEMMSENYATMFPHAGGDGFGKSRIDNYTKPLSLDIRLAGRHLDQVLRFAIIKPVVVKVFKLINHDSFRAALGAVDEFAVDDILMKFLNRVDKQITQTRPSRAGRWLQKTAGVVRQNVAMQIMFANMKNVVEQTAQIAAVKVVAPRSSIVRAIYNYAMNPAKVKAFAVESSAVMKNRADTHALEYQRRMEDVLTEQSRFKKVRDWAVDNTYIFQTLTQNHMDMVVWTAVYESEIAKNPDHSSAVAAADTALILTQGDYSAAARSEAETNPLMPVFQMFYGYFNMMANLNGNAYLSLVHGKFGLRKKFALGFNTYFYGIFLPSVFSAAVGRALGGGADDDDDGEYLDDMVDVFIVSQVKFLTAMVPFVGSGVMAGLNRYNDKAWDDRVSASPVADLAANAFGAGRLITKDEIKSRDIKDLMNTVGAMSGLPIGPVSRPVGYLMDVESGRSNPTGPIDYTRGLITGNPGGR